MPGIHYLNNEIFFIAVKLLLSSLEFRGMVDYDVNELGKLISAFWDFNFDRTLITECFVVVRSYIFPQRHWEVAFETNSKMGIFYSIRKLKIEFYGSKVYLQKCFTLKIMLEFDIFCLFHYSESKVFRKKYFPKNCKEKAFHL